MISQLSHKSISMQVKASEKTRLNDYLILISGIIIELLILVPMNGRTALSGNSCHNNWNNQVGIYGIKHQRF